MTLKELLSEEGFEALTVLNEDADLERVIMTVESTETPDVSAYIPRHTFLITTGMAFRDDQSPLCRLIEELDALPCAGMAIKLGRFIHRLDPAVIETANRLAFPLIQIPKHMTLGQVYHDLLSRIWNNQNALFLGALNAQKKISNLILQGSSLKSILNNLTSVVERPVAIANAFGLVIEAGYTCSEREREEITALMEKRLTKPERAESESPDDRQVFPIKSAGRYTHYLIISGAFDEEKDGGLTLIMEQVILALELFFHKDLYMFFNRLKSRSEFLTVLLGQFEDETWNPRQILAMGESCGMKHSAEYQVVLIEMKGMTHRRFNAVNFTRHEELFLLINLWVENFMKPLLKDKLLVFPDEENWRYVLLLMGIKESLRDDYIRMHAGLKNMFGMDIDISQGNQVSSVSGIRRSFDEALAGLSSEGEPGPHPFLKTYRPGNVMELFKLVSENVIREICQETLKELAFPAGEMMEDLNKTLYAYINNGGSITKTSESLFLHRNTVKYRIKKCEEILRQDLTSAETCFQVQLALVLSERIRG